jgi:hypothetical protein
MPMMASVMIHGALRRALGEESEVEAQQAVGAHLEQHSGEQHGTGGGSFDVRVRQPGVEREERHLHGEGDEESEEEPLRGVPGSLQTAPRRSRLLDLDEVEGAGVRVEPDDAASMKTEATMV